MKITKIKIILIVIQILCFVVLPAGILWAQSNNFGEDDPEGIEEVVTTVEQKAESKYKISMSVIFLALISILVIKKSKGKTLDNIEAQRISFKHDSLVTTNQEDLKVIKKEYKKYSYLSLLINLIPIALVIAGLFLSFQAVENMIIKMTSILWIIIPCWVIGYLASFMEIHTCVLQNEKVKKVELDD